MQYTVIPVKIFGIIRWIDDRIHGEIVAGAVSSNIDIIEGTSAFGRTLYITLNASFVKATPVVPEPV